MSNHDFDDKWIAVLLLLLFLSGIAGTVAYGIGLATGRTQMATREYVCDLLANGKWRCRAAEVN
jgi:hypothetical protein